MAQIDCLGSFLGDLSALLSEDTVAVVSDHGTDRRGQLARDPATWTEPDTVERMNVLVAVRGLDGCPMPEGRVNSERHASCVLLFIGQGSEPRASADVPRFRCGVGK